MAAIGRLFVEIGAKTTLSEDLQKAQDSLKAFGENGSNARLAVRSIAASCRGRSMACHGMPPLSCAGSGVGG